MSTKTDYVPGNDRVFLAWIRNIVAYALLNFARWRVNKPSDEFIGLIDDFEAKLLRMDDKNHGSVDTREKNDARRVLEKEARAFVQGYIAKNPMVTNSDKEKMGLPIYDTTPTSISEPLGQATASVEYLGGQLLQLHLSHMVGTPSDEKANYGCKIYYDVFADSDPKPDSGEKLTRHTFTRRKKEVIKFTPADVKKTAYFCIRYENSKGQAGPWGPMVAALIP